MTTYTISETFTNDDDGLIAHLLIGEDWTFGCTFKDADSGEVIQTRKGYTDKAPALAAINAFLTGVQA